MGATPKIPTQRVEMGMPGRRSWDKMERMFGNEWEADVSAREL